MVCVEGVCIYMTFILIQDTGTNIILVNPFTALIEHFTIDDEGILTNLKGKNVTIILEFPKTKMLISSFKDKYATKSADINFLKE